MQIVEGGNEISAHLFLESMQIIIASPQKTAIAGIVNSTRARRAKILDKYKNARYTLPKTQGTHYQKRKIKIL